MKWNKWWFSAILFVCPWILLAAIAGFVHIASMKSHNSLADFAIAGFCFGFGGLIILLSNLFGLFFHVISFIRDLENRKKTVGFFIAHCLVLLTVLTLFWEPVLEPFLRIEFGLGR